MIYRKWSLLTGPTAILAGIIGTVVVADLLFVENHCLDNWIHYLINGELAWDGTYSAIEEMSLGVDSSNNENL
ncbi:hypothetical protein BUALT_Bualt01G0237400 [Buddleja alternifolia]|uniref:Uncharacterized protein n=1 Tax=Buddleja alternifolia TaxID=168488 RepID=A0AAV6YB73_9LAMI|nr:hypothetical protein BUALT_Bualt01G0237400 [Buddleja alternifolia]